jgi:phospholipid transport system substrate-binding protein
MTMISASRLPLLRPRLRGLYRLGALAAVIAMQAPIGAMAQTAGSGGSGPAEPITALYAALQQIQASSGGSTAQRAQTLAPVVDRAFDLRTVLRNSIGMRFETLSSADQDRLLQAFREYTVARYVSTFKPGAGAHFSIAPQTRAMPGGASGAIVDTKIGGSADDGTEVDYVVRSGASGYQIDDVLLNAHISQVATNRADFSATIARGGVGALIKHLNSKTQSFLNG